MVSAARPMRCAIRDLLSASNAGIARITMSLVFACSACAAPKSIQAPSPAPVSTRAPAQPRFASWTDSILASLSPRDKAAQLVWPMVFGDFAPLTSTSWTRAQGYVSDDHVGGLVMSVGGPIEIGEKLNALQRLADVPLIVGAQPRKRAAAGCAIHGQAGHAFSQILAPAQIRGLWRFVITAHVMGLLLQQRMHNGTMQALRVILDDQFPVRLKVINAALHHL